MYTRCEQWVSPWNGFLSCQTVWYNHQHSSAIISFWFQLPQCASAFYCVFVARDERLLNVRCMRIVATISLYWLWSSMCVYFRIYLEIMQFSADINQNKHNPNALRINNVGWFSSKTIFSLFTLSLMSTISCRKKHTHTFKYMKRCVRKVPDQEQWNDHSSFCLQFCFCFRTHASQ